MVKINYIPDRGDIVWMNFSPQSGHEQAGDRPALVLSPNKYNQISGLILLCPITSKQKGYIFELPIDSGNNRGSILVDQIRSIDFGSRKLRFIEKADSILVKKVQAYLVNLIKEEL